MLHGTSKSFILYFLHQHCTSTANKASPHLVHYEENLRLKFLLDWKIGYYMCDISSCQSIDLYSFHVYFRSLTFLHRYCTFQRNEPCSLPVTIEMIAAYMKKKSDQVALQTTFNALKVFGLTTWTKIIKFHRFCTEEYFVSSRRILCILQILGCCSVFYW